MVRASKWRGFVVRDDPHQDRLALGSLLDASSVSVNQTLSLTGRLEIGPGGLCLHIQEGGLWDVETRCRTKDIIGQEVTLKGNRAAFNAITDAVIWVAGEDAPRRPGRDLEVLVFALLSISSLAVAVIGAVYWVL